MIVPENSSIIPENSIIFDSLKNYPRQCIFAFVNQATKKIWIGYSRNFLFSLGRNIDQINEGNHICSDDKKLLELVIIETVKNDKDLLLRYRYWEEYFKKSNWIFYRNLKTINYRTRIDVIKRAKDDKNLLAVKLVSNNSRTIETVGLFDKMEDAEEFCKEHYSGVIVKVIYANNDDTKEYLKWMKIK